MLRLWVYPFDVATLVHLCALTVVPGLALFHSVVFVVNFLAHSRVNPLPQGSRRSWGCVAPVRPGANVRTRRYLRVYPRREHHGFKPDCIPVRDSLTEHRRQGDAIRVGAGLPAKGAPRIQSQTASQCGYSLTEHRRQGDAIPVGAGLPAKGAPRIQSQTASQCGYSLMLFTKPARSGLATMYLATAFTSSSRRSARSW